MAVHRRAKVGISAIRLVLRTSRYPKLSFDSKFRGIADCGGTVTLLGIYGPTKDYLSPLYNWHIVHTRIACRLGNEKRNLLRRICSTHKLNNLLHIIHRDFNTTKVAAV
jgi:hypothetical protein